jgi:hypothetical protein
LHPGEQGEDADRPESSEPGGNVIIGRIAQRVMQCSWIGNATISRL